MQGLPTFTPSTSVVGGGLDSLTSVIPLTSAEPIQPLSACGPFNPTAALPSKTVKKILDLEFLEMAEVTLAPELEQIPGRPPAPGRLPITDISQWLERYSLMAATLASRFPEKAAELFAYQATIIRAERNYEAGRWVSYDRQYRREALARKDLNWSVTDPRLYNEAFTGRARAIPRCNFCLQDSHTGQQCPQNPDRSWYGWLPSLPSLPPWPGSVPPLPSGDLPREICRRYNENKCRQGPRCRYSHICKECRMLGIKADHPSVFCPRNQVQPQQRSRSPLRRPNPGFSQARWPAAQRP